LREDAITVYILKEKTGGEYEEFEESSKLYEFLYGGIDAFD